MCYTEHAIILILRNELYFKGNIKLRALCQWFDGCRILMKIFIITSQNKQNLDLDAANKPEFDSSED